jgi:hypothetical protein
MTVILVGVGVAALAGLTGLVLRGRSARKRERVAAAEALPHLHYCAECDEEWPHAGRACLKPWAVACPTCVGSPVGAGAPASSPAA